MTQASVPTKVHRKPVGSGIKIHPASAAAETLPQTTSLPPSDLPSQETTAHTTSLPAVDLPSQVTTAPPTNPAPVMRTTPEALWPQSGHHHARTASSNILPPSIAMPSSAAAPPMIPGSTASAGGITTGNRRTVSNATASTASSHRSSNGATPVAAFPARTSSTSSYTLHRSASARSGQSITPGSYVALLRKQKATVWCDRAQAEDPRLAAAAKAAKMKATMEVTGSSSGLRGSGAAGSSSYYHGGVGSATSRLSTSSSMGSTGLGMRNKITNRYHSGLKQQPHAYPANLLGTTGVPMRLSASEVGDDPASVDRTDQAGPGGYTGQRNGSGRSSLASGHRLTALSGGLQRLSGGGHAHTSSFGNRHSTGSTPPAGPGAVSPPTFAADEHGDANASASGSMSGSRRSAPLLGRNSSSTSTNASLTADHHQDYHHHHQHQNSYGSAERPDHLPVQGSGGSMGSSSGESRFGQVSDLRTPSTATTTAASTATTSSTITGDKSSSAEDLSRRGSVDERAMTMRGPMRLFVANPDIDSD